MLSKNLNDSYCDLLYGWDAFEKEHHNNSVIDFSIISPDTYKESQFSDRFQILTELRRLADCIDDKSTTNIRLRQKVEAHFTYISCLMGQVFTFSEYIELTQGMVVSYFPDSYIEQAIEELISLLDKQHLTLDSNILNNLALQETSIQKDDLISYYYSVYEKNKLFLEDILDTKLQDLNLQVEFVDVDAYWGYWVDGDCQTFRLRLNTNNSSNNSQSEAKIIQFVYHELLAHCCQMKSWETQIQLGHIYPCFGLTTVHSPEQFVFEGLAQTLPLFMENEFTDNIFVKIRVTLSYVRELVNNNVHIMLNKGKTINECVDYVESKLPFYTRSEIARSLLSRSGDPLLKSYQYVYPISFDSFRRLSKCLSFQDKKSFLNACYTQVLYYQDIEQKLAEEETNKTEKWSRQNQ